MNDQRDSGTWHHGLMARWWAEFNEPEPREVDYLRAAIERFGEPALDLGCGAGRLLLPLLKASLHIDGVDVSADMLAYAQAAADAGGFRPSLRAQAIHDLDLAHRYRTIFVIGTFGIGGDRDRDREGLQRIYRHLEPGGALLINHELPYNHSDRQWQAWRPGEHADLPRPWPETGDRKTTADGDDIELLFRTAEFDPLLQRLTYDVRARLWHDGAVVQEEDLRLHENLYFAQEIAQLLREAGFADVRIEGGYTGHPATGDDGEVMFVARRPSQAAA